MSASQEAMLSLTLDAVQDPVQDAMQDNTQPCADMASSPVWRHISDKPHEADLFSVLRWIDSRDASKPLLGRAARPHFEPIRLGQEPSLAFAASTIAHIAEDASKGRPRLAIYSFGLFGPNGPLPFHLTEYARDRLRKFNDSTLVQFADIFHHRLILLFYRAWADAQATTSLDRPGTDRFTNYIASLTGYGQPALRERDAVPDHAKFFNAGHLTRQTRNPEGLAQILAEYFKVPVSIEEFVPHWIALTPSEQTRLSSYKGNNRLGEDAVIGSRVLDAQHKMQVRMGPMPIARYRSLLPGTTAATQVATWIKNYVGFEFFVDIQLVLSKEDSVPTQLGNTAQLGWTSWLGERHSRQDADDLVVACSI